MIPRTIRRPSASALRVVVLLAVLATGCSQGDSGQGDPGSAPPPASGPTGDWHLVLLLTPEGAQVDLPAPVTLTLDGPRGSGLAGCNTYGFVFDRVADSFRIRGGVATTRKACRQQGVMEAEGRFLTVLTSATGISEVDGRLVLTGPKGTLTFEPQEGGPSPASGSSGHPGSPTGSSGRGDAQ